MRRLLIATLVVLAVFGTGYAVLQMLLEDQCDLGFTPAECARLG